MTNMVSEQSLDLLSPRSLTSFLTGPIIRISPHELHVNDPNFYNTLYSRDGEWHKYDWSVDAFSTKAAIWTADHNVHKGRRRPLSPYFSKAKVSDQEDMIMSHVHRLFDRLALFVPSHETFDLGAAFGAFVRDVINNYIFGKHYGDIDKEDFDAGMTVAAQAGGLLWRTTKFIRFFGPVVKSIPPQIIMRNTGDRNMKNFFQFMMVSFRLEACSCSWMFCFQFLNDELIIDG